MKTFIIELKDVNQDICKDILGSILTVGLNFRKIDDSNNNKVLFVETETLKEQKFLSGLLKDYLIFFKVINSKNEVFEEASIIGKFQECKGSDFIYQDKTNNKRFIIV